MSQAIGRREQLFRVMLATCKIRFGVKAHLSKAAEAEMDKALLSGVSAWYAAHEYAECIKAELDPFAEE